MQSCAELAALSSGSGNTPVACRISDVKANCPVSCIHEMRPVCHDGTPSAPSQSATLDIFSLGTRCDATACAAISLLLECSWTLC